MSAWRKVSPAFNSGSVDIDYINDNMYGAKNQAGEVITNPVFMEETREVQATWSQDGAKGTISYNVALLADDAPQTEVGMKVGDEWTTTYVREENNNGAGWTTRSGNP